MLLYRSSNATIVDFPLPDEPTIATVLPAGIVRLKSFRTFCNLFAK